MSDRGPDPFAVFDPWGGADGEDASPSAGPDAEPNAPEPTTAGSTASSGPEPPTATPASTPVPPSTTGSPAAAVPTGDAADTGPEREAGSTVIHEDPEGSEDRRWSAGPRPQDRRSPPRPALRALSAVFLRRKGVAMLQELGTRLEAHGHRVAIQDLLDLPAPALRLLVWPEPSLLEKDDGRTFVMFEVRIDAGHSERVTAWTRPEGSTPEGAVALAVTETGPTEPWLQRALADFVTDLFG